jgi:hypothetical protein
MSTKKEIDALLKKLPEKGELNFEREQTLSKTTSIVGQLKGRENNELVLKNDDTYFFIPEDSIIDIIESDSKPHIENEIIEVNVKVSNGTIIKVMKYVNVDIFNETIGTKPLVYDIPSRSHDFIVSEDLVSKEHDEWLKKTGLSGYTDKERAESVYTTYYSTPKQTSRRTPSTTGTAQNDTQVDYSIDWVTDTFNDPTMDLD